MAGAVNANKSANEENTRMVIEQFRDYRGWRVVGNHGYYCLPLNSNHCLLSGDASDDLGIRINYKGCEPLRLLLWVT